MHYIGERNKTQQEIIHLLLQESMYHSGFVYFKIHLDRHDVLNIKSLEGTSVQGGARVFYPNLFYYYVDRNKNDEDMSFLVFCRLY